MAVKVAFIGSGGIARLHMGILSRMEDVQMVSFCDVDGQRATAVAEEYGGKGYTDHREMLEKEDLQAVYICLPPFAHSTQEIDAAEKGIALFVEKPVALTQEKAEQIRQTIEAKRIIASVGYNWRYLNITREVVKLLKDRKVSFALGSFIGGMPGVPWWRVMSQSGGQIVEQTTHIFDLARYLLGQVKTVYATASSGSMLDVPDFDVHDASTVTLTFANGAVCTITSACIAPQSSYSGLTVYTRDLTVEFTSGQLTVFEPGRKEIIENQNDPYFEENKTFIEAVRSKDPSKIRSTYADAVQTLRVTLAANQSIAKGRPIRL